MSNLTPDHLQTLLDGIENDVFTRYESAISEENRELQEFLMSCVAEGAFKGLGSLSPFSGKMASPEFDIYRDRFVTTVNKLSADICDPFALNPLKAYAMFNLFSQVPGIRIPEKLQKNIAPTVSVPTPSV